MVKCPVCEEKFFKDNVNYVKKGRRYYHKECIEKQEKQNDANSLEYKEMLFEVIKDIFSIDYPTPRILNMIKKNKKDGLSYFGMAKTLEYWFILEKNSLKKANGGIGIVPYVYEDALKYYSKVTKSRNSENKIVEKEVIKVSIKKPKKESVFEKRKISIDEL
jgi:hypothetical protein